MFSLRVRVLRAVFALIPALMLTLAVPLINRVEPHVFGLPFLLAWIVLWLLLTPLFLYAIYRMEGRT